MRAHASLDSRGPTERVCVEWSWWSDLVVPDRRRSVLCSRPSKQDARARQGSRTGTMVDRRWWKSAEESPHRRIGTGLALGSARMKGENDTTLDAVDADAGA